MMRMFKLACLMMLVIAFVTGCDSQQKIPQAGIGYGKTLSQDTEPGTEATATKQANTTDTDKLELPPLTPITARELMPSKKIQGVFEAQEGRLKGRQFAFTYEITPDGYILTITGLRRVYLKWDQKNNLVLSRDDDFQENVRVMYDPGLILLPARLDRNEPYVENKSKVTVYNLTNGQQRAKGDVATKVTAIWQSQINTGMKVYDTYIVREQRQLDLDIAKVNLTLDTAFAPGQGEILQMEWRTQKALDLFIENTKFKYIRVE